MSKRLKERIAWLEAKQPQTQGLDAFFICDYDMTPEEARAEYERQHPGCNLDKVIFVEGV